MELTPELRFIMPDPRQIETIQRDLLEKDARLQRARTEMDKVKDELGLTDEDLKTILDKPPRPGEETRRGRPRR